MRRTAQAALGILASLIATQAFACTGGLQWIIDSGNYTMDITNDTPTIDPGQEVHFDFVLYNKSDPAYGPYDLIPYSSARVELTRDNETMYTQDLVYNTDRELAGFDMTFPDFDADYMLHVRFMRQNEELAATAIALTVGGGDSLIGSAGGMATIAIVLIVGLFVVVAVRSRVL